jgi:hypothetical protein
MGDSGFSSTFGLAAGLLFAGDVFAGSRILLSALIDFNCDGGGTAVECCWNVDVDELIPLLAADGTVSGNGAVVDVIVAEAADADFSAMATFSFILARRMLLLVDLTLFG